MTTPRSPSSRPGAYPAPYEPPYPPPGRRPAASHRARRQPPTLYLLERPASPRRRARFSAPGARPGRLNTLFAAAVAVALLLTVGDRAMGRLWAFLDFGAGVLALVSLTATTLWGMAAGDRLLLGPDHRLLAQGVHRGTAVAGLGFLALHIWVKVATGSTGGLAAAVPFTDGMRPFLIGLGTLSGYLFLAVAVIGAARSAFATPRRSPWWRALHMGAYPAWGMALVHGLKAGREAAGWVTASYALCALGMAGVLVMRLRMPRTPPPGGSAPVRKRREQ
ncbi:hypothetical protein [Streptomyces sp. JJ36]|uniref:hypothetical protein n=1 Tax=Streptomyces sp. JJ36 TaxID=2736645 RepID=UPI001F38D682|nr:hypothetical protein [Streptomyces sp. JJ36]MCF6523854.1 hypothetical protein [Streptomyces sp. JJ36]